MIKFILLLAIFFHCQFVKSQTHRYTNTIFSNTTITTDLIYGTAPFLNSPFYDETNTTVGNLVMDIYEPAGDTNTNRPAIIFTHGGGFVDGDRNHDDMVAFCDSFARKGYVTATIDYRQGVWTSTDAPLHYTRAVYRGMQDGRSAVRFLRANADNYGINPDMIFFGGSSAGAFIGLQNIYMDEPEEKPSYAGQTTYGTTPPITAPDLGDYDIGDHLSFNGEPDAVMGLWGAVANTNIIESDDSQPVFLVHGTNDNIVPFDIGSPFQITTFPETYGSNQINISLNNLGLDDKEKYFVNGEGHEFYGVTNGDWNSGTGGNEYWDTVVSKATQFFYQIHKPSADFEFSSTGLEVNFFDLSEGAVSWLWQFDDGSTSNDQNPVHNYASPGSYQVLLYIENEIASWDSISYIININYVDIHSKEEQTPFLVPNPAKEFIYITEKNKAEIIRITIRDINGIALKVYSPNSGGVYPVSDLLPGLYFVEIIMMDKSYNMRFIKQ